jgi:hypothetical protein
MRSGEFKMETMQFRCALTAIDLKQSIIFIAQDPTDVSQIHVAVNEWLIHTTHDEVLTAQTVAAALR